MNFKFLNNTNYKTFHDLVFDVDDTDGALSTLIMFDNGYGASVIRNKYSYGGRDGFYELAVLNSDGDLCYDTSITSDVFGWLDEDGITEILKQIQML